MDKGWALWIWGGFSASRNGGGGEMGDRIGEGKGEEGNGELETNRQCTGNWEAGGGGKEIGVPARSKFFLSQK
jgi:hypothetical protein